MSRIRLIPAICSLVCCAAIAGCRGNSLIGSQTQGTGNSSVDMVMTDTPPSTVTILSAKATLTGATLSPGNVSLFSGSATVDLVRLQTDIAYIATATNVAAGNYTSITITFANPSLTIENDTGNAIVSGATTCAVGAICTIAPTSVVNLSATISLASGFTVASAAHEGLLIDVNLDNLLSATLGANFGAGTTVTSFTPAGTGAPIVGAEDVVGEIANVSASSNTFTLTNATGSYSLKVDNGTTLFPFPTSVCTVAGFSCLKNGQILSVDIGILADGSLEARNILFEDADSSDTEIEGPITSTNAASQQFNIVIQSMSAAVSGLSVGQLITVQYSNSVQAPTPFDLDLVHADSTQVNTSPFHFAAATDLAPAGQQVSVLRNGASTSSLLKADRVRLRSSRITATVQSVGAPNIYLFDLPSIFSGHGGVTEIQTQTTSALLLDNNQMITLMNIPLSGVVSVRGPLFNAGTTQNLVASKVIVKP